jgi:hypothetical protein
MYAGGANDGSNALAAPALSLGVNSLYSGGSNDGSALINAPALSLNSTSSYSGGADDGASGILSAALNLGITTMYSGGSNDGFNIASASALSMNTNSSYSGGANDGASGIISSALNLGLATMYAGGSNDGVHSVTASSLGMAPTSNMYSGGSNDGFSSFTASSLPIVALPIVWEDFGVAKSGKDAWLHWQVGNERNDAGFDVERSFDGNSFSKIGFVKALAGTALINEYQFRDANPSLLCGDDNCKAVYYRLRQIELGGQLSYSPIRKLMLDAGTLSADVYPNPASGKITVRINTPNGNKLSYTLSICNSIGAIVYSRDMLTQPLHEIDVRNYPAGIYYLRLSIDGHSYPFQITITH